MRLGVSVPGMRRVGLHCLLLVVLCFTVASRGWAAPRFGRPGTFAVDGSPIGIGAAAIDSQPARDLVTANEAGADGPSLSILFNRGSGSFFPEQRVSVSTATDILQAVAAGDFNADGHGDVAVAVDDASTLPVHAAVLVYLNNKNNGFAAPTRYPVSGLFSRCLEAVDVNEDGALDLILCHARSSGGSVEGLITVLSGQRTGTVPNGTFQQTFSAPVGTAPAAVAVGDVDADGRNDLVVVDTSEQRTLILYGTTGTPAFATPVELGTAGQPVAALINSVPDLPLPQVLVATVTGGKLLRYTQPTARAFAAPVEQRIALLPQTMGLADMDGSGVDDLIVVSALGAELWYGDAAGTFQFGETITDDDALDALTIADLNGDQRLDIAASASSQDHVTVVLNGVDVPFTPAPTATITQTPTHTVAVPTPTRTLGGPVCAGDCSRNGEVIVNELIQGVNIALDRADVTSCPSFDLDGDGQVNVNELIAGVNSALNGCTGTAR